MEYDKELIAHKLQRWDKFITDYHLPDWETIPDFGLYMNQVIVLLEQYLSFIPAPVGGKGALCHVLHHQQLRSAEDHARAREAEIPPHPHRVPHHDPDHEAEPEHQRCAEDPAR